MKYFSLVLVSLIAGLNCSCAQSLQITDGNDCMQKVVIHSKIKIIDSSYILLPELILASDDLNVKIPKPLYFSNNIYALNFDGYISLQKKMGLVYVNILVDEIREPPYLGNSKKAIPFSINDKLGIIIDLKDYFPFEIGEYRVQTSIKIECSNKDYLIQSEWANFSVNFIPVGSIYNE